MLKCKITHLGPFNGAKRPTYLFFADDPDDRALNGFGGRCSISVWYTPKRLKLVRVHRFGKDITASLSEAQCAQIQDVIYCAVARAALGSEIGFEVELDL